MTYPLIRSNEWVRPSMKNYRLMCCDCSLIHEMDFKVVKAGKRNEVMFRTRRVAKNGRALK